MRVVLVVAAKDVRQRLRDRSAIIIAVLAPLGLALVLSSSLGAAEESIDAIYGIVDADGGPVAQGFVATLEGLDFTTVLPIASEEEARRRAEDDEISAAIVIPEGFSAAAVQGEGAFISIIGAPDSPLGAQIARSVAESFAGRLNAVRLAVTTVIATRDEPPAPAEATRLAERARGAPPPAVVAVDPAADRLFDAKAYYSVGMAVFFVFFTVEFGVRSLLEERQLGTLSRMLAGPVRPSWIVTGKALSAFAVGIASTTVLVVATSVILGANWGDPVGVGLLVLCAVVAAMGVTALVATLARTPEQASSYSSIAAVVMGLIGGTFFPISQAGGVLAALNLAVPHGWLMRAFGDLSSGGGVAEILPAAAAVVAFGVVTGAVAVGRSRALVAR